MEGLACIMTYLDKHCHMHLDTKDYTVKQIRHVSEDMDFVALVLCQWIQLPINLTCIGMILSW